MKIYFNVNRDYYNPEIGIVIKDYEQTSYIGLNNKHLGDVLKINKGTGIGYILIDDFPLYASSILELLQVSIESSDYRTRL